MPTVIDSLIVSLGLDSKDVDAKAPGVRKKLQELEMSAGKSEKATQGLGKELKGAAGALGSFLAVLGGTAALKVFINDAINANTQLRFLSQNLGMTVQSLFGLGAAGQMIGVGKNALQGLAAQFRELPGQLQAGQQPAIIRLLARAGVSWEQSPDQMMVGLARWFQTMPAQVATGIGTSYGLSFDQMSFLLQGASRVASQLRQGQMYSPTERETRQAAELKQNLALLSMQWHKIGYDVLSMVTPALEKALSVLRSLSQWAQSHEKIVAVIAAIFAALGSMVALAGAVAAFGAVISALAPVFAALASPVGIAIAAIAALAAGIVLLWNDYKVWSEGGKSLFDWSAFASVIRKAGDSFNYLKDKIEEATGAFGKWWKAHISPEVHKAVDWIKKEVAPAFNTTSDAIRRRGYGIAAAEGFFHKGANNIPQRANNPGDISWGDFARQHGATGYISAAGGHKIAVFPSEGQGWDALYSLLGQKRFATLTDSQAYGEYTRLSGSALASYVSNASSSGSVDNSHTTHIGQVTIQSPLASSNPTPSMVRGMDFTTLVAQASGGLR